jgi:short-subunit dehydrogenase
MPAYAQRKTLAQMGYRQAVVTGASSGIGLEIAKRLSEEGLCVIGMSRTPPPTPPPNYTHIEVDLLNPHAVERALAQVAKAPADLWINNAGHGLLGGSFSPTQSEIDAIFQLMLHIPIRMTRFFAEHCNKTPDRPACLVQVTSLAVELPIPDMPYYNAAKSALSAFSESLRLDEDAPFQVIDFRPGDFNTSFIDTTAVCQSTTDPEYLEFLRRQHRRAPSPQAAAVTLIQALKQNRTGLIRAGNFFQAVIAPLGRRFLPGKRLLQLIRHYYKR